MTVKGRKRILSTRRSHGGQETIQGTNGGQFLSSVDSHHCLLGQSKNPNKNVRTSYLSERSVRSERKRSTKDHERTRIILQALVVWNCPRKPLSKGLLQTCGPSRRRRRELVRATPDFVDHKIHH